MSLSLFFNDGGKENDLILDCALATSLRAVAKAVASFQTSISVGAVDWPNDNVASFATNTSQRKISQYSARQIASSA